MKIFISQPMANREPEAIIKERNDVMDYVRKMYPDEKVEEIRSYIVNADLDPLRLLGMSLELMSEADLVVFTAQWMASRGCCIEHQAARAYRKKILDLEG